MNILEAHIDERLVHGQVALRWIPLIPMKRVIVIDDESAASAFIKQILRIAVPNDIRISVLSVNQVIENLLADRYKEEPLSMRKGVPVEGKHGPLNPHPIDLKKYI